MGDWRNNAKQRVRDAAQGNFFTPESGENCVRVLPNAAGTSQPPFKDILVHREVGPNKRWLTCGKDQHTRQGKCWICDVLIPKLRATDKQAKIAIAEALEPLEQSVLQIAVIKDKRWSGPLAWNLTVGGAKSTWAHMMTLISSTRRSYDNPKKGYNINFTRTGQALNTTYSGFEPDNNPSEVPSDILRKLKPFDQVVQAYDGEAQKAAWFGKDYEKDTEAPDEDETSDAADEETQDEAADTETLDEETVEADEEPDEEVEEIEEEESSEEVEEEEEELNLDEETGEESLDEEAAGDDGEWTPEPEEEEPPPPKLTKKPAAKPAPAPAKKPVSPPAKKPVAPPASPAKKPAPKPAAAALAKKPVAAPPRRK